MAEYVAKRDPKRCPTHPGELLKEIIPATGKTKAEIAALLGNTRQHLYDILAKRKPGLAWRRSTSRQAVRGRTRCVDQDAGGLRHLACRTHTCPGNSRKYRR